MDQGLAIVLAAAAVYFLTAGRPSGRTAPAALPPALTTSAGSPTRYGTPGPAPEGTHWEIDKNQAALQRVVDGDGNAWALVPDGF